jgi:hypothetical protein
VADAGAGEEGVMARSVASFSKAVLVEFIRLRCLPDERVIADMERIERGEEPNVTVRFWRKIEPGRHWQYVNAKLRVLGSIRYVFDGWYGYVCTGKAAFEPITLGARRRDFWSIRRAVEQAVDERERRKVA